MEESQTKLVVKYKGSDAVKEMTRKFILHNPIAKVNRLSVLDGEVTNMEVVLSAPNHPILRNATQNC